MFEARAPGVLDCAVTVRERLRTARSLTRDDPADEVERGHAATGDVQVSTGQYPWAMATRRASWCEVSPLASSSPSGPFTEYVQVHEPVSAERSTFRQKISAGSSVEGIVAIASPL